MSERDYKSTMGLLLHVEVCLLEVTKGATAKGNGPMLVAEMVIHMVVIG